MLTSALIYCQAQCQHKAVSEVPICWTPPFTLSPVMWYPAPPGKLGFRFPHSVPLSDLCVFQGSCFSFPVSSTALFKTQLCICYSDSSYWTRSQVLDTFSQPSCSCSKYIFFLNKNIKSSIHWSLSLTQKF